MTNGILRFADRFAALGHEVRLDIVRRLLAAHPEGRVAGELQLDLDIPASTLSHHLDALRQAGLVEQRREGRFLRYRAVTASIREISSFLSDECRILGAGLDGAAAENRLSAAS
jgi:ArsR family transcriptional regulator, arsenate/arsenite/antimonite-responsive transcriptional repressor